MKKQFLFLFFFAFLLTATTHIQAQDRTVSGTVKDYEGKTLSSATVMVKGTTYGVPTNGSGGFKIKAGSGSVLVISKRGFIKEEINTGTNSQFDVTLYPNTRKGKRKRKKAMKKKK